MSTSRVNITDRAQRYRAQNAVTGPRKCVLCGSRSDIQVMHLDGNESHGEAKNLAYGCRSCNGKLSAAFKRAGIGRPTNQYNPGTVPTFDQYAWAVSSGEREYYPGSTRHKSGAHDEAGAVIHATPKHKRIEYAKRIARSSQGTRRARSQESFDRWNPAWPSRAKVFREMEKENDKRRRMGMEPLTVHQFIAAWYPNVLKSNPWPFSRPDAKRTTPAHGGIAYHQAKAGKRPAAKSKAKAKSEGASSMPDEAALQAGFKRGLSLREILAQNPSLRASQKSNPAKFDRCVKAVQAKGGANAYAVCTAAGTRNPGRFVEYDQEKWKVVKKLKDGQLHLRSVYGDSEAVVSAANVKPWKRNPAAASAEVFEEFHGYAPSEIVTVTKHVHHHEHLAAAGKLVSLDVWGVDETGHKISGFKGAFLAFNETKNQLFVEGGDQSIDLADFGIDSPHELETLGRLTDIGYQTNKTHLGDEGGEAVYVHKFRTTNDKGRHVVVKIARYPDLIYDVRNEQLLFSGGSYEILREGINK